jgi:hypothetical protein
VGSSRGSINMWDLSTLKSIASHTQLTPHSRATPSKSHHWPVTAVLTIC